MSIGPRRLDVERSKAALQAFRQHVYRPCDDDRVLAGAAEAADCGIYLLPPTSGLPLARRAAPFRVTPTRH
jgi:hypothetical protein